VIIILGIKCCGFTGHRKLPKDKIEYVRCSLRSELLLAVMDGYTNFLVGFADGADLEFAEIIIKAKAVIPNITIEAVLPFEERLDDSDIKFQELIKKCDKVTIISEKNNKKNYLLRNQAIVMQSGRLIAVFNGSKRTGTAQTIRIAGENKLEIKLIDIKNRGKIL